ncbi:helix-turn-helix domain-containing protein [Schaedlerella arabinosiphila]|uniref:helix-turn-helix domain-containing protein n=1 Tax=Schaedlerella arabinosiphila TaxID=2044587 RepID=UPI0025582C93|nr:helix-turn-helix transcriptional regulator [Schaedlerella arabinosiphila]
MPNMNFDVLKENISSLMKENNMTQQQLGDVIGISQSNVNKCLKCGDNSRSFRNRFALLLTILTKPLMN